MPIRRGRFAPQNTFLETIAQKFDRGNSNFVLGSAQEKNNYPIVYCSDGFCELTGFSRSELMRRSCGCSFLYGLDTSQEDKTNIQKALKAQVELKKEIIFYKKNGSPFWCLLDIVPIKNEKGNVVLFLASHKDITKRKISGEVSEQDVAAVNSSNATSSQKLSRSRSRKFSRDVLLHLSRQYQQNNGLRSKTNPRRPIKRARSFSFNSERLPQYKRESDKKSKFLFLHYSTCKGLWDWWILILTTYIAIMVPYNVAFRRHDRIRDLIIFDMVIELFFIMDIVVHFRTTFVDLSGRIIYDQKKIAVHYLKGWFILDFLAALPFEALYFINQSWGFLIQLLKCGRLLRLFRVVRKLHRYTEYSAILLTLLMIAFAMMAHWLACIWYVIGLSEIADKSTVSWLFQLGEVINKPYVNFTLGTGPDEGSAYVTALYFTLTSMTTVGFGNVSANTNGEKVFAVVTMLIGALMHAAIFGNVAAIIQKLYANRVRYHSRANEIKQFIRVHRIEQDLANRLEDYFHTTWSLSGGVDTREILVTFPDELQSDVCMHLYKGLLELSPFNQATRGCLRLLSLQVRTVYIGPGEVLLAQNDVINAIYYIANGSMEVLQGESVAAILGKGDVFGEDISRKIPVRRANGDVRALTYCDVYFITRERLQTVLHFYQDFTFKFSEGLELTYDLGASERDIWRRGGLDSISEDEEEGDEIDENTADNNMNHVTLLSQQNNYFGNGVRFNRTPRQLDRKPNHFNSSQSWLGKARNSSPTDWKSRLNHVERQPLLLTEEESSSRPQSPRSLTRQLAVDVNASPRKEPGNTPVKEVNSNEPITSQSLEWEQESFSQKNNPDPSTPYEEHDGKGFEMKNNGTGITVTILEEIAEEVDQEETDNLPRFCSSPENHRSGSSSQGSTESLAFTKKLSTDFSKHLYLSCDDPVSDEAVSLNEHLGNAQEHTNTECLTTKLDSDLLDVTYNDENIGYTNFETPPPRTRSPRFSFSQTFGDWKESAGESFSGSALGSPRNSIQRGFAALPFKGSISDSVRLSLCTSPDSSGPRSGNYRSSSPRFPVSRKDSDEPSTVSQSNSDMLSIPENTISTRNRLEDPIFELRVPSSPAGSLKEGRYGERPGRRKAFRRAFTELSSPPSSCGSLNEKQSARRRKVSAVMQPPTIFAPLLVHANNPYKDFVPPLRETAIVSDGEPAEDPHWDEFNSNNGDVDISESQSCGPQSDHTGGNFVVDSGTKEDVNSTLSRSTLASEHSLENKKPQSDSSQKLGDSSLDCSSLSEPPDDFVRSFSPYSIAHGRPSLSGAYSSHCIEQTEKSQEELSSGLRPMRTSFSEPHLLARHPDLGATLRDFEQRNQQQNGFEDMITCSNLEDIFHDVASTKEAIERLHSILSTPEQNMITDLADTKQTVQNLGKQVSNLNKEVASLGADVKAALELLKGLQNGQVTL